MVWQCRGGSILFQDASQAGDVGSKLLRCQGSGQLRVFAFPLGRYHLRHISQVEPVPQLAQVGDDLAGAHQVDAGQQHPQRVPGWSELASCYRETLRVAGAGQRPLAIGLRHRDDQQRTGPLLTARTHHPRIMRRPAVRR